MQESSQSLRRKLAATRLWWRTAHVLSGILFAVSAVVALALLCYHFDRRLTLSAHARELWRTGIGLTALVALLTAFLRPILRRLSDAALAADVERRYPVLRERLLTTLDLAPGLHSQTLATAAAGAPVPSAKLSLSHTAKTESQSSSANAYAASPPETTIAFSSQLTAALVEETHRAASGLDFRRAVDLRSLRVGLLTAAAVFTLLALHIAFAGEAFAVWIKRMTDPRADIAPYARTRVQVIPDAQLLPVGADTGVTVRTWGDAVEKCTLRVHQDGDDPNLWTTLTLQRPDTHSAPTAAEKAQERTAPTDRSATNIRRFHTHFRDLAHGMTLIASANDGRSNERVIRVEPRPALFNVRQVLRFPAYMHRPAQTIADTTGAIAAPVGTQVQLTGIANKPLRAADCTGKNVETGAWRVEGDKAYGQFTITRDGAYSLRLTDRNGFTNLHPTRNDIHAQADEKPNVTIQRPAADIDLVPDGSLPLVAHADDDYGVETMRLAYEKTHEDTSRASGTTMKLASGAFGLPGPDGTPKADVRVRWNIGSANPHPGDTLRYEVDALDNDTLDGPHLGRSVAYHIHIVSLPEMQRRLKDQLDEEQRSLSQLRTRQIEAQKQLQAARQKPDTAALAKAQEAQRSVAQETKSVSERMQQLSNQLENNNLATPSELTRRTEAQKTLENSAQQKMTPAADKVQQAQSAKANSMARRDPLAQADKQEAQAKRDIEAAQQMLARAATPEELAKETARLAQEQQRLADSARALADDIKAGRKDNPSKPLTEDQKSSMAMERQQQQQTSQDTKKLQSQLDKAAQNARDRGENAQADAMKKAAEQLKKGEAASNQKQAQSNLDKNNPQQAAPAQDKAASALQKAADEASKAAPEAANQTPKDAADQLEQTAKQLQELAKQQKDIASQVGKSPNAEQSKSLAQQEKALQQEAQKAQQGLQSSKSAEQSLQKAQQSLSQSQQQLSQNSPQSAKSPSQSAAQQLEKAAQQAKKAAQQLKQQQAAQEMQEKVERLAQVEHALQSATQRLEESRQKGTMSGAEVKERRQVAQRQAQNEQEAHQLAQKFPSPAFQKALEMAAGQMQSATKNLNQDEPNTSRETQQAQNRSAQTLDTVAQALKQQAQGGKQDSKPQDGKSQDSQQQEGSPQQKQAAEALGEMMLGQGLQKQLRQDTGALDQQRNRNEKQPLTPQQKREAQQLAEGQRTARDITDHAADSLAEDAPEAAQQAHEAGKNMGQAQQQLGQQRTGQPTQGQQDQAIQKLDRAVQQAQQALQQQQQQQQAQQQGQQGAPQPGQKKGGQPKQAIARMPGLQRGELSAAMSKAGRGFAGLPPRAQRVLREGQQERVPAEYQDLVSRYYKSLAEKKR